MEDNSQEDDFKISPDQLREYLRVSQKDPNYEVSKEKKRRFSSSPTRDELIEMIERVHQAVLKLDEGTDSRTEKCITLLEKLSDACFKQTNALAEHKQAIEQLQKIVKRNNTTMIILMGLTLLSISCSLTILAAPFVVPH